jgi:hypothetical protein
MTTTTIATADYLIIAGFFAVMLVIGSYFGKRVKSLSQFFGGGKEIPWWLGGVSFFMVSFSALAFVMHSELVYKYGSSRWCSAGSLSSQRSSAPSSSPAAGDAWRRRVRWNISRHDTVPA